MQEAAALFCPQLLLTVPAISAASNFQHTNFCAASLGRFKPCNQNYLCVFNVFQTTFHLPGNRVTVGVGGYAGTPGGTFWGKKGERLSHMKQHRAEHRHAELPDETETSQILVPITPASSRRRNLNPRGKNLLLWEDLGTTPRKPRVLCTNLRGGR